MTPYEIGNEARRLFTVHQTGELEECLVFLSDKNLLGFIEVGSANGGSFYSWGCLISSGPKISVDLNHGFGLSDGLGGANSTEDVYAATELAYPLVRRRNELWREKFGASVVTIEGNSMAKETIEKVKNVLMGSKVGWVFIDAWHEGWAAELDLRNYSQFLSPDGYIGFHDVYQSESMKQFWEEAQKIYKDTIEIKIGTGIGIIPAINFVENI